MHITAAAEAAGVTADTLRYYERAGVLPPPPRRPNGYRDYTEDHVLVIQLAKALRDLDVPLHSVREIVRVAHDGTCGDLRERLAGLAGDLIAEADRRIAELRQTRQHLDQLRVGLNQMKPRDASVPGISPCECVEAVRARPAS